MNEYEIKVFTETSGPAPRSKDDFTLVMPDGQKTILKISSSTKLGGWRSDSLMNKVREAVKDDKGIKITKIRDQFGKDLRYKKTMRELFISSDHPIKIIRLDVKAEQDRQIFLNSKMKLTAKQYLQKKGGQSDVKSPKSISVNGYNEDLLTTRLEENEETSAPTKKKQKTH